MIKVVLKLVITMATAKYLCQKIAVQNVPNKILGKVINFGFPFSYRFLLENRVNKLPQGEGIHEQ